MILFKMADEKLTRNMCVMHLTILDQDWHVPPSDVRLSVPTYSQPERLILHCVKSTKVNNYMTNAIDIQLGQVETETTKNVLCTWNIMIIMYKSTND